jgi:predicted DNA binding CopG/RHH family protein
MKLRNKAQVTIYLENDELELIKLKAKKEFMTVSQFIRKNIIRLENEEE